MPVFIFAIFLNSDSLFKELNSFIMSDKKYHPVKITEIPESNYELGKILSKLRYDQIAELLSGFADGTKEQEKSDRKNGKVRLAESLSVAVTQSENMSYHFAVIADRFHQHLAPEYLVHPRSKHCERLIRKLNDTI